MGDKRCETYVNFHRTGKTERHGPARGYTAVASGECRIGPPAVADLLAGKRWPLVFRDDWCGCHVPADGLGILEKVAALPVMPVMPVTPEAERAVKEAYDAFYADVARHRGADDAPGDPPDVLPFPGVRPRGGP